MISVTNLKPASQCFQTFKLHLPLVMPGGTEVSVQEELTFYSNKYPTRCNVTQFILSENCSTCFEWYHHPSSGVQTTVSTASGICHTVTATCRYRGRVGTGLSVLWVANVASCYRSTVAASSSIG
jgi:hypothetical protein